MAYIDKIYAEIENKIFHKLTLDNVEYTRADFRKYKKTKEYNEEFTCLYQETLDEIKKQQRNKELLTSIENISLVTEDVIFNALKNLIIKNLSNNKIYFIWGKQKYKLKLDDVDKLKEVLDAKMLLTCVFTSDKTLYDDFFVENKFIRNYLTQNYACTLNEYVITDDYNIISIKEFIDDLCLKKFQYLSDKISDYFTSEITLRVIFSNQRYSQMKNAYQINTLMLDEIPDDFTQLYPQARLLKRHFILHIGDTNTGKTYQAIQELKAANSGTYLAPLRLLALEIQERLNNEGTLCSMTTGEEEDIVEGANHMSSTIEKLDINKYYDVCVIDEAQMIEDEDRGWAWTTAILGAYSERIHICMSENARNIVIKLINLCNDTYEIVEHVRNTELMFEHKKFNFKNGIKKHDALIVFSRKKVLSVATELENMGIKASVIYGALPYSVRKNEIRKFIDGETDVVVSTDAIGMGMNLPIQRIVFLESTKFDGKQNRYLKIPEVKQIAGRAGRLGMFEKGIVNSMIDADFIEETLFDTYTSIPYARIQLPKSLLSIDLKLSEIMLNWSKIPDNGCFKKSTIEQDLKLCQLLESTTHLTKETMLDLINIPFDENNEILERLWHNLILCHFNDGDILTEMDIPMPEETDTLDTLELKYKQLDLYFSFARTVNYNKDNFLKNIMNLKEELSIEIMEKLKTKETYRTCRCCGKKIPWDYEYSSCQKCFKNRKKMRW